MGYSTNLRTGPNGEYGWTKWLFVHLNDRLALVIDGDCDDDDNYDEDAEKDDNKKYIVISRQYALVSHKNPWSVLKPGFS